MEANVPDHQPTEGVPVNQYHISGDMVNGDKIEGDKVLGNKIQIQNYIDSQVIVRGLEITDIEQLPPEDGEAPYKGLDCFTEKDADWFFGRDEAIATIVDRLHALDFLAVIGASGSGKSSLIRAGVIPVMKRKKTLPGGKVPPLGNWCVYTLTPTARPLAKLADTLFPDDHVRQDVFYKKALEKHEALQEALLPLSKPLGVKIILFIDQFEELFTQCKKENERKAFITNLLTAQGEFCKILITLRADFYGQCLRYKDLRYVLKTAQEPIGAMNKRELTAAILEPAAKGNWQFQAGLTEEMLDELGDEPGRLPLLSHALLETWQRRRGRMLTLSGYREAGKIRGAIACTAESVYAAMSFEQQEIIRSIFLNLVEINEGTSHTRRRVELEGLLPHYEVRSEVQSILERLADERLIVISGEKRSREEQLDKKQKSTNDKYIIYVEIIHEALIRYWRTLQNWIERERSRLAYRSILSHDVKRWKENDRNLDDLYTGRHLALALSYFENEITSVYRNSLDKWLFNKWLKVPVKHIFQESKVLHKSELEFLEASVRREKKRRDITFLKWCLALLFFFLLVTLTFLATRIEIYGGEWQKLGGIDSGNVTTIAINPGNPANIYAAVNGPDESILFESNDTGNSWLRLDQGLQKLPINDVLILSKNSNQMYLATEGGGVFRSVNGGKTWVSANEGLGNYNVQSLIENPERKGIIYLTQVATLTDS